MLGNAGVIYKAVPVAANSTVTILGSRIGGFIPTTAGTWSFTLRFGDGAPDLTLPNIVVPAGQLSLTHEIPIFVGNVQRSTVTTSGGAAGILLVA